MSMQAGALSTVKSTPGSLVHYRKPTFGAPLWPGIHFDDDPGTLSLLGIVRPQIPGSITPILLLGEKLELCWALDSQIHEYNPFAPELDKHAIATIPGLSEAYALAESALGSGIGLDHWKEQIVLQVAITVSDDDDIDHGDSNIGGSDPEDVSDLDDDTRAAILQSHKEYYRLNGPPNRSRSARRSRPLKRSAIAIDKGTLQTHDSLRSPGLSWRSGSSAFSGKESRGSESRSTESDNSQSSSKRRKSSTPASNTGDYPIGNAGREPTPIDFANRTTASFGSDQLFRPSESSAAQSDAIEGDLSESGAFVQIYVGPERQEYTIAKQDIWNRVYFRDPVSGRNYFDAKGEKTWELVHPRLAEIDPEDFNFITEYLSSADADFGHRAPEETGKAEDSFAQCVSVWKTADMLGMYDLLDHIVNKLRTIEPWWNSHMMMLFASNIYQTTDFMTVAHTNMRYLLSTYIAENFFSYMTESSEMRTAFLERLKQLPQLERDIYRKRLERLDAQLPLEENMEIQEEGAEISEERMEIPKEASIQGEQYESDTDTMDVPLG